MKFKLSLALVLLLLVIPQILAEECQTPDLRKGRCVPLHSCPEVMKAFANPLKESESYLRRFICDNKEKIKVCCDVSNSPVTITEGLTTKFGDGATEILLSDARNCKFHSKEEDFVLAQIRATDAELKSEFTICVGSLINPKYVLTAAQCLKQNVQMTNFSIVGVRFALPGHDVSFKYFDIEEQVSHPFYYPSLGVNDIALLRLNETVLSDEFKPICLVSSPIYHPIEPGYSFRTYSGLDTTSNDTKWLNMQLSSVAFLPIDSCKTAFEEKNSSSVVTTYDRCTEDLKATIEQFEEMYEYEDDENTTEPLCNEYPGMPLFYVDYDYEIYLAGISASKVICDDGLPDVYIDVLSYRDWILENMRQWSDKNEQCKTPSGKEGDCRHMLYCPELLNYFSDARNETDNTLREYICKREKHLVGEFSVCCASSENYTLFEKKQSINVPDTFFEAKLCGIQQRDDYLSSSDNLTIDEFTWIALIERSNGGFYSDACSGVLINARYVLTTTECVVDLEAFITVRLGDFSQLNDTDCVKDLEVGEIQCGETEVYGVEERIVHPFYTVNYRTNAIALLRLNRTVRYTDYIRPICLPFRESLTAKPGDTAYVSSWGPEAIQEQADIERKVRTQLITNRECQQRFRKELFDVFLNSYYGCVAKHEDDGYYIDRYDFGGAVMFVQDYRWQIEGILTTLFFEGDKPQRYVKISKYMNWILENMRPWSD